jgi:hypothetical protein
MNDFLDILALPDAGFQQFRGIRLIFRGSGKGLWTVIEKRVIPGIHAV